MLTLPLEGLKTSFKSCCGKTICNGCIYTMHMSEGKYLCPFCREPNATAANEHIERTKKLMDKGNAEAFNYFSACCVQGRNGMPRDFQKANELWLKAGELGCAVAYHNLGISHERGIGVDTDLEKAKHYHELAAIGGHVNARFHLGSSELRAGNVERAMKHFILAARAGHEKSLEVVKFGFTNEFECITKDAYADILRTCQKRRDEMKSDMREKARVSGRFR